MAHRDFGLGCENPRASRRLIWGLAVGLLLPGANGWCQAPDSVRAATPGDAGASTRSALWRGQREQRAGTLRPEKTGTLESLMLWVEKRGLNFEFQGVAPGIGNFPTGAGFAPQLRFWFPRVLDTPLDVQAIAAYSIHHYQSYSFQIGRILSLGPERLVGEGDTGGLSQFRGLSRRQSDFFLYGSVAYNYYPEEDFFGIGPDSREEDRSNYLLESTAYTVNMGYRPNRWVVIGGGTGLVQMSLRSGKQGDLRSIEQVFAPDSVPGLSPAPDYYRSVLGFFVDFRDVPGNAHKGGLFGFQVLRDDQKDGDQFEFTRYTFDAREYISLGSPQRVLALWFLTSMDDPDPGSEVPFYLMRTLGGGHTLRGFRGGRFRDTNRLHLSGEYRWEASPALEFALFYDAGKVFGDRAQWNFTDLEDDFGFGTRFKTSRETAMRVEVANSHEGTRFAWKFSASF